MGELIVFYKSDAALREEWQQIQAALDAEFGAAGIELELNIAATQKSLTSEVLAQAQKLADDHLRKCGLLELAELGRKYRRENNGLRKFGQGEIEEYRKSHAGEDDAGLKVCRKMADAFVRYTARMEEHNRLVKRSERFFRRLRAR